MKKRIGAVILGVLLTTALMGVTVFAASSSKIVSGATGTYVKGSKKAHQIVVETSVMSEAKSLDIDGKSLDEGKEYTLADSMRPEPSQAPTTEAPEPSKAPTTEPPAPTTSEAPAPSQAPTTSEAPAPSQAPTTSEAPAPSQAPTTSEAPVPSKAPTTSEAPVATSKAPTTSEAPVATSKAPTTSEAPMATSKAPTTTEAPATNSNIFAPIQVQAEETLPPGEVDTRTLTYTISGEYLETLSLGEHKVAVNVYGAEGLETLNAVITVVAQQTTTSETPVTSQAPTSETPATATTQTSQTSTTETEEEDEDDADDNATATTKKKNNTTSSKKSSKKSKSSKTGDSSQIMLYLAIALVSGCAIVYFARKKTAK